MKPMHLVPSGAFTDNNYIWMHLERPQALMADPGEAAPVLYALEAHALDLVGILVTHITAILATASGPCGLEWKNNIR